MSQRERDRLKVLHEAGKGLITQRQAAEQLQLCERQVRRLLERLKRVGDGAVVHGLRGRSSNRRIAAETQARVVEWLKQPQCRGFGPTFAAEQVAKHWNIRAGKDTIRKWMIEAGVWQSRSRRVKQVHQWRPRRCCAGELVQWDSSVHDWLEGRGERLYLIAMIDDATSRLWARFATQDTTQENMRVLWGYLERYGRPLAFYTDKAGMFERPILDSSGRTARLVQPTQITRALAELDIGRISAHSPQAKGRIERFFGTAQDRLIKGLRLVSAATLEAANAYLDAVFLPEWNTHRTVPATNPTDAHRPLSYAHDLAAALSHVENRRITNDYTFQFQGERYQIARDSIVMGMKGRPIRVEARLDGTVAARFDDRHVDLTICPAPAQATVASEKPIRKDHNRGGRSSWMKNFSIANRNTTAKMHG